MTILPCDAGDGVGVTVGTIMDIGDEATLLASLDSDTVFDESRITPRYFEPSVVPADMLAPENFRGILSANQLKKK